MSSCWGSGEDEYNNINPNINNGSDGRSIEWTNKPNERTKLTKPVPIEKTSNGLGGQRRWLAGGDQGTPPATTWINHFVCSGPMGRSIQSKPKQNQTDPSERSKRRVAGLVDSRRLALTQHVRMSMWMWMWMWMCEFSRSADLPLCEWRTWACVRACQDFMNEMIDSWIAKSLNNEKLSTLYRYLLLLLVSIDPTGRSSHRIATQPIITIAMIIIISIICGRRQRSADGNLISLNYIASDLTDLMSVD